MQPDTAADADLHLELAATPTAIRDGLGAVMGHEITVRLSSEERGTVELVLAEILNNISEHAYAGGPIGRITLTIAQRACGLAVTVEDQGCPMPGDRLPAGLRPEIRDSPSDQPEGGFGWFLVRELARDLAYCRRDGTNRLRFRIAVGTEGFAC